MSTPAFRNVALIGATGTVGSKILTALNTAGFTVTAVGRKDSKKSAPTAAKSVKVEFSSESDLTSAFKNIDVVISALPSPKLATDKIWMQAAIGAGVKRIVLSEFSTNLETELSRKLPIVKDKIEIRKYVEEITKDGKIEWSSVNNGPFFVPWLLLSGWLGPNPKTGTALYHDGGNAKVATSTLERIGEGVVASLLHPDITRNKPVYVYSTALSERDLGEIITKLTGQEFKETTVNIASVVKEAEEALAKGDYSKMGNFFIPFCYGEGYGGDFRGQAMNKELGLEEMSESEVESMVKVWLESKPEKESHFQ